jgi:predicted ATPase
MDATDRFFIITGGPGSGKSSLIEALQERGYSGTIGAGRGVIQDQVATGGSALPWGYRLLFAEMMLSWEVRSYHMARLASGTVFFDRGVPDVLGYLKLCDLTAPPHMLKAAEDFRYNRRVFIAPPWQDIFRQDRERKQDFDEAVRTCEALVETYAALNYTLVELPRVSIEERLRFILDDIENVSATCKRI